MIEDFTKVRIIKIMDKYTQTKVPKHLQDQIRMSYKIRGNSVTLIEERPAYRHNSWVHHDVAQFRLDQNEWKVFWKDSKNKWHFVEDIAPDNNFEKQLEAVDTDNSGMFWG